MTEGKTARAVLSSDDLLELCRKKTLQQAVDLMQEARLSPGQVAELYVGGGIEVALAAGLSTELVQLLRQLADEIEAGTDLN